MEAALVVEIVLGKGIQAGFIVLMLLFAAVNGAIQSTRARVVLRNLSHELTPLVAVKRSDKWVTKPAKELVVGDLISLRQEISSPLMPAFWTTRFKSTKVVSLAKLPRFIGRSIKLFMLEPKY